MKKLLVLAAGIAALGFVGTASAADMPTKAPMMMAPVYNWTGFYVGLNGGYGTGTTTGNVLPVFFGGNYNINGGVFGGQIGYNYQMSNWVLGIEADYDWANIKGSNNPVGLSATSVNVKAIGTVRGRVGYAWDRALLYGTGGWAWGAKTTANCTLCAPNSDSHTLNGYAVGGGLEYGFTQNLSGKIEYLYAHLSPVNFFNNSGCTVNCSAGANVSMIRAGVNWRFTGL